MKQESTSICKSSPFKNRIFLSINNAAMVFKVGKIMTVILMLLFLSPGFKSIDYKGHGLPANSDVPDVWYKQPMRIAALQSNFNEDNLAVIDKWVDMGFNVEQLFHPIADNYSAIYKPTEHRKILEEYVKKAHEKNMKIILYLNVHILGPTLEHNKEIWSQRKQDNSISYLYATYPSICLNSKWKDYFYSALDSLNIIDIDGIFLDGPVITSGGCFCDDCKNKYHEIYGSELEPNSEHVWEFNANSRDDFLKDAYDYWKKDNPEKIFYMNLPVEHTKAQYTRLENALEYNDIVGTEGGFMFYGPAKNAFLWRPSFTAKLIEAVAPEKPRVIFMAGDHKPWSWWLHSPLETKLCIASVYANDANVWYGLHGSSKLLNTESAKAAKEALEFYKKKENLLINTKSAAEVGLFYSFANATRDKSDFVNPSQERIVRGDAVNAIRGYYSLLTESQIPFDIVTDYKITLDKLDKYKVLIIPNVLAFDKNTENVIREFVKKGGKIISELGASLYNNEGESNGDFSLSDVFGVSTTGNYSNHKNYNYFETKNVPVFDKDIQSALIPLPLLSLGITIDEKTEVLGEAIEDLAGVYVPLPTNKSTFITKHKFGKGEAIYFAGNIGEMYNEYHVREYRILMNNIISNTLKEGIEFENAPSHLEIVLRKQKDKMLLHLINYQAGPTRPFENITPVHDLKIKIPEAWKITKSFSNALNTELKGSLKNGKNEFILPVLHEYEILEMEKE